MITLPENFVSDIIGYIADIFSDFKPLVLLIFGIAVGFWIISRLLMMFLKRKGREASFFGDIDEELNDDDDL